MVVIAILVVAARNMSFVYSSRKEKPAPPEIRKGWKVD